LSSIYQYINLNLKIQTAFQSQSQKSSLAEGRWRSHTKTKLRILQPQRILNHTNVMSNTYASCQFDCADLAEPNGALLRIG